MDRDQLSRLPFLAAFIVALAGMPLDIYNYSQRQIGFAKLSPWQRRISSAIERIGSLSDRLLTLIRTPRFWQTAVAATVLILVATHQLHAQGAVMVVGLTSAAEIREQINKLGVDMRAITEKAKEEKRSDLTAEEETSFDKMNADREVLLKKEERLIKIEELETGQGRRTEPRLSGSDGRQSQRGTITAVDQLEGMRAWLQAGTPEGLGPQHRAAAAKVGINAEAKGLTIRLAPVAMRSTYHEDVKDWESRALSTLTTTSPEDGSYLIANELLQPLERAMLDFGGIRQVATVKRTLTGAALGFPTSDDTSNEGVLLAENAVVVAKDTEFGIMTLNAYKFSSKMVLVSVELMQDSATELAGFLGTALGERIGRIVNRYGTTGTGSSQPMGIVTAATSAAVALAAQTPTYAEMVSIEHSVDPAYRNGARWMFHDTILAEVKKIVDASTGRPIWMPNMVGGQPDTILGYPYTVNQHMAVAAGSGSGKSILFGQLSKYILRDVRDVTLLRLDERYAEYHQVAFLAFSRHDGDLLDAGTHPVKYGANKA